MTTDTNPTPPEASDPEHDGTVVPFPPRPDGPDAAPEPGTTSDTSFEVTLDDEPAGRAGPVDAGEGIVLPDPDGESYPVIPEHLRSLAGIAEALGRHGRRLGHRAGFHGIRAPRYLLLGLVYAVAGVFRLTGRQLAWWWVSEQDYLRSHAVAAADSREWMRLHREVRDTRRTRGIILAGEAFALLLGTVALAKIAPWWGWLAAAAVVVPALARAGRPEDRPIISPAMTVPRFRVLNADVVLRAYYAAGLGHPDKPGQQVEFESAMTRDGDGSRVRVVLPYGTGFDKVVKAKDDLAAGLDVAPSQVYLTRDKSSHRRHALWVADRDPLAVPAGKTPLLDLKRRSIWQPAPFGLDERGRKVTLGLLWISILVGAQPRKGKTFSGRLLALFAALDPSVRLSVVDGKNSPDWNAFRKIAYHFIHGIVPSRDGDPVAQLISALTEIKAHIIATNEFLATLPFTECPRGKLTEELCAKYPKRLFVWVLVMEEFQNYFELPDQKVNAVIADLLAFIMAVGPSSGVIIVSLSQKPSGIGAGDVQRLFNRYRDNHTVRFALRCGSRVVSDAILGGDAYSEGFDASSLPVGEEFLGVGYLYGAADHTPTVRCYLADAEDTDAIVTAARVLRERAGTLAGFAAGQDTADPGRDVLADVLAVFGTDTGLHWQVLADRLAEQFPARWADATADAISAQVRALEVPGADVRYPSTRAGKTRAGCRRADVETAAQRP